MFKYKMYNFIASNNIINFIKYLKYLLIIISIFLVSCSSLEQQNIINILPSNICNFTKKINYNHSWEEKIKYLKLLDKQCQSNQCSQKIQLDLIYAYYKNANFDLVLSTIDHFMYLNPVHPKIDYVIYMKGLSYMKLDNNLLHSVLNIDYSDRDPQYALYALNEFYKLIHNYPESIYYTNSIKNLDVLKNRLAKYEYHIAKYYSSIGAWVAVVNRVEYILNNYQNTIVIKDSLKLMENAYNKMHMKEQANKVSKMILVNEKN